MPRNLPLLALLAALFVPLVAGHPAHARKGAPEEAAFRPEIETIGGLRLGMPAAAALAALACTPRKLKEVYEGATGEYVQTWRFDGCGVVLKMASPKRGGAKTIASITVFSPCSLATSRGIRVGSAEQEVVAAYGRYRDRDGSSKKGELFVAGSIFDGMLFHFDRGKVTQMFLGAAAE